MRIKAKGFPTLDEAIADDDLGVKIGTKEQGFLEEELRTNEKSEEALYKAIDALQWMNPIIKKRIKELDKETISL